MSAGGSEELQRDVVRIAERQARPIRRVHDAASGDIQLAQSSFPFCKLRAVGTGEREVIEANSALVEWFVAHWVRELVEADECLADEPDDVAERSGVLVEDGFRTEERFVPRDTSIQSLTVSAT